jgi:hypothetical protein
MDKTIEVLCREAIFNAESASAYITKPIIPGTNLESIIFSTTKGNKILCAVGVQITVAMNGPIVATAGARTFEIIDDWVMKVDNQLRMKSSDSKVLLEMAELVADRQSAETILGATGSARSTVIIPVSGVGGRQVQLDLDFAAITALYTTGTFTSGQIVLSPMYTDTPLPQWSFISGTTPNTGTGAYKVTMSGDFVGNGYVASVLCLGDATINLDDIKLIQEDGRLLYNQKQRPTQDFHQNIRSKAIYTPGGAVLTSFQINVNSTLPWNTNSSFEVDVVTAGTMRYGFIFKNSPTATSEKAQGQLGTPTPETAAQPQGYRPTGPDTRNVGIVQNPGQTGGFVAGLKRTFNI